MAQWMWDTSGSSQRLTVARVGDGQGSVDVGYLRIILVVHCNTGGGRYGSVDVGWLRIISAGNCNTSGGRSKAENRGVGAADYHTVN